MRGDVVAKLATVDLFAGLSTRQLKRVAAAGTVVTHSQGKTVVREGGSGLYFHLILDGEFDVMVHDHRVQTLGQGECFGELSLIDGKPRSATVIARSPGSCFALSHADFDRIMGSEPGVAKALLVALAARLREAETRR